MVRPLQSAQATSQFLLDKVAQLASSNRLDTSMVEQETASSLGFSDWKELTNAASRCGVLRKRGMVVYTRTLDIGLPRAWELISTASELSIWMFETKMEPKIGGRFEFPTWGGVIEILDPMNRIRFRADEGGYSELRAEPLSDTQSRVRLIDRPVAKMTVPEHVKSDLPNTGAEQHGGEGTHWAGVLAGWHSGIDSLESYAADREFTMNYHPLVLLYDLLIKAYHKPTSKN